MATTVWLDRPTHARLLALKQQRHLTSLGAVIRSLLDEPVESAQALYRRRKAAVDAACKKHGVRRLVAFGSRARGDARPDSDLDLMMELPAGRDLFDFQHAKAALEQAFACPVDIIGRPAHRARLMAHIKREQVILYEAR